MEEVSAGEKDDDALDAVLDDDDVWPSEQERQAALLTVLWSTRSLWQHRLVYRISVMTTTHARVEAGYQVLIRKEHLELAGVPSREPSIRVLVPLTWRPKELLLNNRVTASSGSPAHLLTRVDTAGLAAGYFLDQLRDVDLFLHASSDSVRDLVESIARFMPRRARVLADGGGASPRGLAERLRSPDLLAGFLSLSSSSEVSAPQVERWSAQLRVAEGLVSAALGGEPASPENSATNVLLALSELPSGDGEAMQVAIDTYVELVLALHVRGMTELLGVLGRLGSDWMVVIETDYELDRPLTITMSDDRPLNDLDERGHVYRVPVPLGDAGSLHVETQVSDSAVVLDEVKLLGPGDSQLPLSDDVRETQDRHAVYVAGGGRPDVGTARIRIALTRDVRWTNTTVLVLALVACLLAVLVDAEADIFALLVIPTTLAVSVVQVRETSSVVRRLTSVMRACLFAASVLWLVAALRLLVQTPGEPGLLRLLIDLVREDV